MAKILGIETTCDETSASIVENGRIVLSNIISSQAKLHNEYGGIVPELASRKHLENLPIVVEKALTEAEISIHDIDAIAIAKEPGLPPALVVGYSYASGLAIAHHKKLIEVNHLEAHVHANWLIHSGDIEQPVHYPYICLLVSGGHTQLRLITSPVKHKILGKTLDDAAGESFDKIARLLGLPYPGGPSIQAAASEGDDTRFAFPRAMLKSDNHDFSFSGLKTAVSREYEIQKKECGIYEDQSELHKELCKNLIADTAASFQEAVIDVLISKTIDAANELGIEHICIAGGVSANARLREQIARVCHDEEFHLYFPEMEFCVDNAAMIAGLGYYHLEDKVE